MRLPFVRAVILLVPALCTSWAAAATIDVSGFGTAGFAFTDNNKAQFARDTQGDGVDTTGDLLLDSLAGIQATAHLSETISATIQGMLRHRYDPGLNLDVPLAFVKDQFSKDFAVRVGRVALPAFLVSDFRQVGYANTWVRPPIEVYGLLNLDQVDGVDILFARSFGPVSTNAEAFYGKSSLSAPTFSASIRKFSGVNVGATMGPLTLRIGADRGQLTLNVPGFDSLTTTLRTIGFTSVADRYDTKDKTLKFLDVGFSFDWKQWIAQGEVAKFKQVGFLPAATGKYLLAGYRVGVLTPYVIYADHRIDSPRTEPAIPHAGPLLPLALGLDSAIAGAEQNTTSLGLRWDFHESLDLKIQLDRVKPEKGTRGSFNNVQAGFEGPVIVGALVVDFVF